MSFLAPLFLFGALAVAAPILFHLIRRTSREKIPFSSLMFLQPTPPRLTRGELTSLRSGRPSPAVRTRLFKASDAASATADVDDAKPYPSQQPPSGPRKR